VEAGDEVSVLFILNDLLEFKSEPRHGQWKRRSYRKEDCTYSRVTSAFSELMTSYLWGNEWLYRPKQGVLTLIMTKSVDWKSEGFDAGSNIDELDWKDEKRPVISRLRAKLL
jgi:hypothetical protein